MNLIELLNTYTDHQQRMTLAEAELLRELHPRFNTYENTLADLRETCFYPSKLGGIVPSKGSGTWYAQSDDWRIGRVVQSESYLEVESTVKIYREPDDEYVARIPLWLLSADWVSVLVDKCKDVEALFKDRTQADADADQVEFREYIRLCNKFTERD